MRICRSQASSSRSLPPRKAAKSVCAASIASCTRSEGLTPPQATIQLRRGQYRQVVAIQLENLSEGLAVAKPSPLEQHWHGDIGRTVV